MGKQVKTAVIIIMILLMCVPCNASTTDESLSEFFESVPDEISDIYYSDGFEGLTNKLEINNALLWIAELLGSQFKNCTSLFTTVCVLILLFSFLEKLDFSSGDSLKRMISCVISVSVISVSIVYLKNNLDLLSDSVQSMKVFSTAAVPVIITFCIASGETFSGTVFSSALSFSCSVFETVTDKLLMPLIIVFISFGCIGVLNSAFNSGEVNNSIKKFIKWVIGIFIGIFTSLMSMQKIVSSASDNLAKRSLKTALGSVIPIIGSTISGSIDGLFALGSATKTSLCAVGVIVIVVIFASGIIGCLCYGLTFSAAKLLASFMNAKSIEKTVGVIADAFYILAGITSACVYMMIISFVLICFNI